MTFREKIDWLSLIATVIVFGWYFWAFPYALGGNAALAVQGGMLLGLAIVMAIVMTVATVVVAIHKPSDANAPADERDREITRLASTRAYYVMLAGIIFTLAAAFYFRTPSPLINMLLASTVLAECVRLASQIVAYRRGY